MARNCEISDGVMLPSSVCKNSAVTCSQESYFICARSVESEDDDVMIIEDGTEKQGTPVGTASRGNISVFQSKEETLAAASEGLVREECSDDAKSVTGQIVIPPRISLSAANRIKCDVRRLYRKRMKQRTESSEFSSTKSKVDNSPNRLSSLSYCKSITTKADVAPPIQNEGQYTCNSTGISSIKSENAVLSSNATVFGQHAFSSGHRTSLSRSMPLQKKKLNKDIIPGLANSDMKIQSSLSSEHSVVSPAEVCASVVPRDTTSESGKTPDKNTPHPPGSELESIVNKLHYYMSVLFSDTDSKENEPRHHSSDKGQGIGFTSTNTNTLVRNEKVVSETGHDQSLSISVARKKNTSTVCEQIAPGSPLCSNVGSKGKEIGTSPKVRGRKKSDCAARNHSVSNLCEWPLSLSGSLVPCIGNTPTTQKHNSAFLCSTADKQCIEPDVTTRKLEMTQLQSRTTTSISIPCEESISTEYEHTACGAPLCSSVENGGKEILLSPEIKRKKISDCIVRKSAASVLRNLEVLGSSSGSSLACVGSTGNASKQSSIPPFNTAGEDFVEPSVTVSDLDKAHPPSQNLKLSREISQHPRKYSLIKSNSFETLMAGHKTPQKRSPSKKLSKNSPIKYVRNNRSPFKQMSGCSSANRMLKFGSCDTKKKLGSLAQPDNQSSVPDVSYKRECVSYFESIIAEVLKDKDMLSVLSEEEVNVVTGFWKLEHQVKKLYIRMLSRKYTWHRVSDIKYDDINVLAAFTELELSGLITSGTYNFVMNRD